MHIGRSRLAGRPIVAAIVVSLAALTSAAFVAPATAQGTCNTGSAPAVYPENQLQPGTMATGLTTIQGRTPQSFDAKVLGILPNAILPGHDIILVKISGPVVDQTGGGFFGMSGSPVSIGDQLVGAVAYGPPGGYGDQTIMGLTPAQDMVDVLSYQDSTSPQAGASRAARLSPSTRARVARVAGESASQVPNQLVRLKLPFAVSGLNGRAMSKLRRYVKQLGLSVVLYRAASAPSYGRSSPRRTGRSRRSGSSCCSSWRSGYSCSRGFLARRSSSLDVLCGAARSSRWLCWSGSSRSRWSPAVPSPPSSAPAT